MSFHNQFTCFQLFEQLLYSNETNMEHRIQKIIIFLTICGNFPVSLTVRK